MPRYKDFGSANSIMIDFITNQLPVGLIGIVVAGVFAAAMSSVDSLLNSMSTVFVIDIYERFIVKNKTETSLKRPMLISAIGRLMFIIVT